MAALFSLLLRPASASRRLAMDSVSLLFQARPFIPRRAWRACVGGLVGAPPTLVR